MAKTYFIGLGGCGLQTVSELQKKLSAENQTDKEFLFTYIDTDEKTRNFVNKDQTIIRLRDFINLGDTNPLQTYMSAVQTQSEKAKRLQEWCIKQGERGHLTLPNETLSDGAQAVRMFGRFGYYKWEDRIKSELKGKLQMFQSNEDGNANSTVKPDVWVFASSCGGTGSSMTLDVLYAIDRIVQSVMKVSKPDVKLVLFMPQPFIDRNSGNHQYYLNAFAYMWELNAFRLLAGMNDSFGQFAAVPPEKDWDTQTRFELFRYVIPVDTESDLRYKIQLEDLYSTVAEMVYYLNKGKLNDEMFSLLSNDQQTMLEKENKYNDTCCPWTTPLIAYGYKCIKKANDELKKYLKTRGMYELVKHGLLGDDIEEEKREEAKLEFASKYILPFLMTIGDTSRAGSKSLQTSIQSIYEDLAMNPAAVSRNLVENSLNEVASKKDSREMVEAKKSVFAAMKESINSGVGEAVQKHGLIYAKTLLNLVDDYYLEQLASEQLEKMAYQLETEVNEKRSECESHLDGLSKKNKANLCASAFNEYLELETRLQTVKASIELIGMLTENPDGYLEELRKGRSDRTVGLQELITRANSALARYAANFEQLAKDFKSSESNAFTYYLPNLRQMALGENENWPSGTMFDQFYANSILDYDREFARRNNGRHVPVHTSEGDNNLLFYMQRIDSEKNLFIRLAMSDKFNVADRFDKMVITELQAVLDEAIAADGTEASKWMALTLEDTLNREEYLPAGVSREKYLETLGTVSNIHVLYPTSNRNNDVPCRYLYAGGSLRLAETLGYGKAVTDAKFIEDSEMKDRFIIMKMPYGLDFYSYSHFSAIERMYNKYYPNIKKLAKEGGCHIHQAFIERDIEKAAKAIDKPKKTEAITNLFGALYYQAALKLIKANDRMAYNELFQIVDFSFMTGSASEPSAAPAGGLSAIFGALSSGSDSPELKLTKDRGDHFISAEVELGNRQVVIKTCPISYDQKLVINFNDEKRNVVEQEYWLSIDNFANRLLTNGTAIELEKIVNTFEDIRSKSKNLNEAFINQHTKTVNAVFEMGTETNPKLSQFVQLWQNDSKNDEFLIAIQDSLNNMIQRKS